MELTQNHILEVAAINKVQEFASKIYGRNQTMNPYAQLLSGKRYPSAESMYTFYTHLLQTASS